MMTTIGNMDWSELIPAIRDRFEAESGSRLETWYPDCVLICIANRLFNPEHTMAQFLDAVWKRMVVIIDRRGTKHVVRDDVVGWHAYKREADAAYQDRLDSEEDGPRFREYFVRHIRRRALLAFDPNPGTPLPDFETALTILGLS